VFIKSSPTCTYDPLNNIPFAWNINYWFIDKNTHVLLPIITTNVGVLKPAIFTTNLETNAVIKATNKDLSTIVALVIMDPYEPEALMRFTALVF
jgi:hypothetical protein